MDVPVRYNPNEFTPGNHLSCNTSFDLFSSLILSKILVIAWLLEEQPTMSGGGVLFSTALTKLLAIKLCKIVVFPVPGGPLIAKISE